MTQPTEQDRPMSAIDEKLSRGIDRWQACDPILMAGQSQAALIFAFRDMKNDILKLYAEAERLQARVAELEAICENVPEGCTPADARVLREANHALIDEAAQAKWHKDIAEAVLLSVEKERDIYRDEADLCRRKLEMAEAESYANGRRIAIEERDRLLGRVDELETELVGQRHKFDVLMSISAPTEKDASALLAKLKADAAREALTNPKPTNCWKCSDEYEIKLAECPHCGAANANVNWDLAKDQIEREGGV